jgi:hypothetical protein
MSAPENVSGPMVLGRACGECQECCIALSIDKPDIQKMPGAPCRHSLNGGCDIYENRPGVCRGFFCGWRRLASIPADWRPDRSGILVIGEENDQRQFKPVALTLFLTGNPLKTIRRTDFLDFVLQNIRDRVALYLMLPGGKAMKSAKLQLNGPLMESGARSRGDVKAMLELSLKTHQALPPAPHVMENSGHNFGT